MALLICIPAIAHSETRLDVHAGGGLEGGMIQGEPRPDGVAEVGIGASALLPGRRWGAGVVLEQVSRVTEGEPITRELKLDAMLRVKMRRGYIGVGMGVRRLAISGGTDAPSSTVDGVDLLRLNVEVEITRSGPIAIDLYVAWTFGIYSGEIYGPRYGDMAYPMRDYSTMTTAYVVGLQTSLTSR